jgi:nucleoside 2-deoxyribosyltransferase
MDALISVPGQSGIFEISDPRGKTKPRPTFRPTESTPDSSAISLPSARVVLAFGFPDFDPIPWVLSGLSSDTVLLWDHQGWLSRTVDVGALTTSLATRKVYLANLNEMRRDVGASSYAEALDIQPPYGFDLAVIKCGRWGTLLAGDEEALIPSFHMDVVSAIGSGDAFGGALAKYLAQGRTAQEAALRASAAAALFVERAENLFPINASVAIERLIDEKPRSFVNPRKLEETSVYLAGPFFTAAERLWLDVLEGMIEELGFKLVSPRRDVGLVGPAAPADEARKVGRRDLLEIDRADLVVANIDGRDAGTLIEVGYASSKSKPVFILDTRPGLPVEPMTCAVAKAIASTPEQLLDEVTKWARENLA